MVLIPFILICISNLFDGLSILLNVLGVYLLAATKPLSNSKILLINLALSEIIVSTTRIARKSVHPNRIFTKIIAASWTPYYFSMYLLTVDRLLAVKFLLKYRVLVTKRRLVWTILGAWLLSLVIGVPFFLEDAWFDFFKAYMWIIIDVCFVVLCFFTYGLVCYKNLAARRRFDHDQQEMNSSRRRRLMLQRSRKLIKMVALIIISYLIFILIPDVIFKSYSLDAGGDGVAYESLALLWSVGMMSDPLIYIFLQEDLRLFLKRKVCRTSNEDTLQHTQQETRM